MRIIQRLYNDAGADSGPNVFRCKAQKVLFSLRRVDIGR
jgi:hypothetical protein